MFIFYFALTSDSDASLKENKEKNRGASCGFWTKLGK